MVALSCASSLSHGHAVVPYMQTPHDSWVVADAMSEAIEGASVMLFTVCEEYKESCNCRLEANVSAVIFAGSCASRHLMEIGPSK